MVIALFETVAIVWCYGADRLGRNIEDMTGAKPSVFFSLCWKFVAPVLIFVIWVFTLLDYSTPSFDSGRYSSVEWNLSFFNSLKFVKLPCCN